MSRLRNVEVIHGDSYQFLKKYQGELFCATVTDPPYGVGIQGMDGKRWDNGFPHPDYWRELLWHTEDNGWLVCFASSKSVHRSIQALEDAGWGIQDVMVWIRPYAIGKTNGLKRGWEAIILASKGSPRGLNIDAARICGDGLPQWPSQDLPDNNRALDFKRGNPKNRKETRAPSSVVVAAEDKGVLGDYDQFFIVGRSPTRERGEYNNHPAVKPISLMEHLLLLVNRPGGLILDPFAGSGSTLVAAKKLHMRCLGIEIDEDYYGIALHRLRRTLMNKKPIMKQPLTKKAFESLLRKAAQPLPKELSDSKETETLIAHPSDGYTGTDKNQGKTVDKEGLQSD